MKLTKGQKDALVRKAMLIVETKRKEKQQEYIKNYSPDKETKDFLKALVELKIMQEKLRDKAKKLGFREEYNGFCLDYPVTDKNNTVRIWFGYSSDRDIVFDTEEKIMKAKIEEIAKKEGVHFPDMDDIQDEIELADLDKSFDMDKFLAKYESL